MKKPFVVDRVMIVVAVVLVACLVLAFQRLLPETDVQLGPPPDVPVAGGQTYSHAGVTVTVPPAWSGMMATPDTSGSSDPIEMLFLETEFEGVSVTLDYDHAKLIPLDATLGSSDSGYKGRRLGRLLRELEEQLSDDREKEVTFYDAVRRQSYPLTVGGLEGYCFRPATPEGVEYGLNIFVPYGDGKMLCVSGIFDDALGGKVGTLLYSPSFQAFLDSIEFV
ncbi:hypothetical protein [Arabiibacter massiliensis]|uniref:hypothetical protein n=1 Tax=Arabiibacter massiliensis TaxID=1870985 RepID=UPI0009BB95EA|nr:hypothetical protein [Arabiibacter massiliensis]